METKQPYCRPANAGLCSEPRAVGRRLGRLLDALNDEVNHHVCDGELPEILRDLRMDIIERLRAEGWRIKIDARDNWQVLPPKGGK